MNESKVSEDDVLLRVIRMRTALVGGPQPLMAEFDALLKDAAEEINYLRCTISGYKHMIRGQAKVCQDQIECLMEWANAN